MVLAASALIGAVEPAGAHPSWRNLGAYEKEALREATDGRPLDFEPDPEGKLIADIRIRNLNVFRAGTRMAWANFFHITSTEQSVRQELTVKPGDRWKWTDVQQSIRLLRSPFYSVLAVIVPLRSERPGYIHVLVVTRDRWSIRPNSEFEFQNGSLTYLEALPADNNFLGRRKRLAIEILADQGEFSLGPRYIDPNVLGKRLRLDTGAALIFNRATNGTEGGKVDALIEYPLFTLETPWGGHVAFAHKSFVFRQFQDDQVLEWEEGIPYEFRMRTTTIETRVVRQWGRIGRHRFAVGHRLAMNRPSVHGTFNGTAEQLDRFRADVLPRDERTSALFARFESFKPKFITYRNIDNYDLPEEFQTGPRAAAEVSRSFSFLGSETEFLTMGASIGWWIDYDGIAYMDLSAAVTTRFERGELTDNDITASIKLATGPFLRDELRVVARGEIALRLNDLNNVLLVAGGQTGLRGYPVGAFTGKARAVGNVELRTRPRKLSFMRVGGLVFWDSGHAAETFGRIHLHNDVGVGLRLLIPQVSSHLYRFDWAFPLQGSSAGWPGRISLGFQQIF